MQALNTVTNKVTNISSHIQRFLSPKVEYQLLYVPSKERSTSKGYAEVYVRVPDNLAHVPMLAFAEGGCIGRRVYAARRTRCAGRSACSRSKDALVIQKPSVVRICCKTMRSSIQIAPWVCEWPWSGAHARRVSRLPRHR